MVLNFESKNYESCGQRIMYSFFKCGYVSQKYLLCYKVFFILLNILEFLLVVFLLSANQTDLLNDKIRNYGNFYSSTYDSSKFTYSNFDSKMSFFINFLDIINKLNLDMFLLVIVFLLLVSFIKVIEFFYFLKAKVSVINVTGTKAVIFYIFSFIDQSFKTGGDIIFLFLPISTFSCVNGVNVFLNQTCYTGIHLSLSVISGFLLTFTFFNFLVLSAFYDPSNLIVEENFGVSDNFKYYFFFFFAKLSLVILNVFNFSTEQEIIKISIFLGISIVCIYLTYKSTCKFHNFYQNTILFKTAVYTFMSLFFLIYVLVNMQMSIIVFLLITIISLMAGYLVFHCILYLRTHKLYAKEHDLETYHYIIFILEKILIYHKDKANKLFLNGFINAYNAEHNESDNHLAEEMHDIIYQKKDIEVEDMNPSPPLSKYTNLNKIKYLLTIKNMHILGSVREVLSKEERKKDFVTKKKYIQQKILQFLSHLIHKHSFHSHHNSFLFKHLMTQIYLRKLSCPTKSWFILGHFYETYNKLSMRQKFYVFCMFQELHEKLLKDDERAVHNKTKIHSVIKFDKTMSKFHSKTLKTTLLIKDFWLNYINERLKLCLNSANINLTLENISHKYKKLQNFFNEIQKMYEENPMVFYIYCCFSKNIINNDIMAEHILKLLKDYNEKSANSTGVIDDDYYKMTNIENIGLLRVSCNSLEIGKIKWCNNKISHTLGFTRSEMMKMKINRIIPPIIATKHNEYIKSFIQTSKEVYSNVTRIALMIDNSNYLIPVIIYIKILPKIKNGIEMSTLIHKIIDGSFLLYKNPEIKAETKLCFILINEDGSIESVDKNSNTFLGIPNLVRDGWKLKITIEKRKCNLFELSDIKQHIDHNRFHGECRIDTSDLLDDFNNDENGLYLSIHARFKALLNKREREGGNNVYNCTSDYYESEGFEEESTPNSRVKMKELQQLLLPNIFKPHNLFFDIYQLTSSNKDLHLFLIKIYYPIATNNNIIANNANLQNNNCGNMSNRNQEEEIISNNVVVSKFNNINSKNLGINANLQAPGGNNNNNINSNNNVIPPFFSRTTERRNTKGSSKENLMIVNPNTASTHLGVNCMHGGGNNLSANGPSSGGMVNLMNLGVHTLNTALGQTNTGNFPYNLPPEEKQTLLGSGLHNQNNQVPSSSVSFPIERVRNKRDFLVNEKMDKQNMSYRCIQLMFFLIIFVLIGLVSAEMALRLYMINHISPAKETFFKFITRRDLTSNLVMNTLWHMDIYNSLEHPEILSVYGMTKDKLENILKEDVLSIESQANDLQNMFFFLSKAGIYDFTVKYEEYDSFHQKILTEVLVDIDYDKFISNLDKYFEIDNFTLQSQQRIMELFNPVYYLGSNTFPINYMEKKFLNIIFNGLNLIKISNDNLIERLGAYILSFSNSSIWTLIYINLTAIGFTLISSFMVMFYFLNLYKVQDEIFSLFRKLDNTYSVKVIVICDKFLKLLMNVSEGDLEKFKNFYNVNHGQIFQKIISSVGVTPERKNTLIFGRSSNFGSLNLQNNLTSESPMIKSTPKDHNALNSVKRSSDSDVSQGSLNSKNVSKKTYISSNLMMKRKNSDEDVIVKYKRFLEKKEEDKKKKREEEEKITIEGGKKIYFSTFLLAFIFLSLLSVYFIILIVLDLRMNTFMSVVNNFAGFEEKRSYYLFNSLLYFKFLTISATPEGLDSSYNTNFENYFYATTMNEENFHNFIINGTYSDFNSDILTLDVDSACSYFLNNTGIALSNNITVVNSTICNDQDAYKDVNNKSLSEIITYIINYLRKKYNTLYTSDKNVTFIEDLLNDETLQYCQILTQFIVRQALFVVLDQIETTFQDSLGYYFNSAIILFAVFLVFLIIVISLSNFVAYFIFSSKKRRNELLINLLPNEFMNKLIEEEEAEIRRRIENDY